jgi:aldehyde:ferredoxin oxidoreductase
MKYGGYTGKFLTVDLSTGAIGAWDTPDEMAEKYLGGRGFIARMLYDRLAPKIDPLGPENVIIFATGPATGTLVPTTGRIAIGVKSPLTRTISASYMGGHFAGQVKYAGYDGIIITGVSPKPVTLVIDDDKVSLRDAAHIWGKDTKESQDILRAELGEGFELGAIGPAGENLVPIATFMHVQRAAGRGGSGAVFGSKRLKAVAVRGTGGIAVGTPDAEFVEGCREMNDIIMANPVRPAFRYAGTTGMLPVMNEAIGLPYKNHQDDKAPDVSFIHNEEIYKYVDKIESCAGCNVFCGAVVEFERGGRHYRTERLDHESTWALGPNCGIVDLPALMEANMLCDYLGLDTMSAGGAIAWAMEMTQRGLLTKQETDGLDFSFGNADVLAPAIRKMAAREGFGDLLARGSREAARMVGRGEEYAMQVKGLEMSAYAPRAFTGMGLSFATTSRGADHNKAFTVAAEFLGVLGNYDRYALEGKAHLVKTMQDSTCIIDSLIMCMFTVDLGIGVDLYAKCAALPTGMKFTEDDVYEVGERINTVERLFNIREGFTRADDNLPLRFATEAAPSDPGHHTLDVTTVMDEYYAEREYDSKGVPSAKLLERLGVDA